MNLHWKLEVYDQTGATVATASHIPNTEVNFSGDMIALAEAMPGVIGLSRFITDPDARARATYEEFRTGCAASYGLAPSEWDTITSQYPELAGKWRSIAEAALHTDPTLN